MEPHSPTASTTRGEGQSVEITPTFRIDRDLWERFDQVARSRHRSRSGHVRWLIEQAVEADEQQAAAA